MQAKWDDLDQAISTSFEDVEIAKNYNEKLLKKLKQSQSLSHGLRRINFVPSLSLIAAGLFIILLNTTNLQSQVTTLQSHIRDQIITIELQYTSAFTFVKQLGE